MTSFLLRRSREKEERVTAKKRAESPRVLKIEHTFPQVRSSTIYDSATLAVNKM